MSSFKQKLSDLLKEISGIDSNYITMDQIREAISSYGAIILILIFTLPLAVPLPPIPGLTTIGGLPLLFLAFQYVFNHKNKPYLPRWLLQRSLEKKIVVKVLDKSLKVVFWFEERSKVRLTFFFDKIGEKFYGLFTLILVLSIILPLPFTNLLPALSIVIMSLAKLVKDGLIFLLGTLTGFIGLALTTGIIIGLYKSLGLLKTFVVETVKD